MLTRPILSRLLLCFCMLTVLYNSMANDGHNRTITYLGIEQGLSNNSVRCVFQDHKGFMWFGTEDGLNRFDGYSFTVFKHDPANKNSLEPGMILCLENGNDEKLWIGFDFGGLNSYEPISKKITPYKDQLNKLCSAKNVRVNSIVKDTTGVLWLGTDNGLIKFNAGAITLG